MKKSSRIALLLILLLPALMWLFNATRHQIGIVDLNQRKITIDHIDKISTSLFPFNHGETMYGLSVTDPYVYRFGLGDRTTVEERFEVGGKNKVFMQEGSLITMAYQLDAIYYDMIQVATFDLETEEIRKIITNEQVQGEIIDNAVILGNELYIWSYDRENQLFITKTDGREQTQYKLPLIYDAGETYGFNLSQHNVKNEAVFEAEGEERYFSIRKDGPPVEVESPFPPSYFTESQYEALEDLKDAHRYYVGEDELIIVSSEGSDQNTLSGILPVEELIRRVIESVPVSEVPPRPLTEFTIIRQNPADLSETREVIRSYNAPRFQGEDVLRMIPDKEAIENQIGVQAHYYRERVRNQEELDQYLEEHQWSDFLFSPSSVGLILLQILFGFLAASVLRGEPVFGVGYKLIDESVAETAHFFRTDQPLLSLLINTLSLLLTFWALNPESIYYHWGIWAVLMGLWLLLVLIETRAQVILHFFKEKVFILAIFPVYATLLWLLGPGLMHRKFIAITLALLIPWYYLLEKKWRPLRFIGLAGLVYLTTSSVMTLVQFLSYPDIARALAPGRGSGNFLASSILGNFHSVYMAIPLFAFLLGAFFREERNIRYVYGTLALVQLLFVAFSRYSIALIAIAIVMVLILFYQLLLKKRTLGMGIFALIYSLPAFVIILFKEQIFRLIYLIDSRSFNISERLFNRVWVYLRSLVLYLLNPILGFSVLLEKDLISGNHSDYLEILAEYGIVGFMLFILSWFGMLYLLKKHLPEDLQGYYFIAIIGYSFAFVLNPIWEVSSVTLLSTVLLAIGLSYGGLRESR